MRLGPPLSAICLGLLGLAPAAVPIRSDAAIRKALVAIRKGDWKALKRESADDAVLVLSAQQYPSPDEAPRSNLDYKVSVWQIQSIVGKSRDSGLREALAHLQDAVKDGISYNRGNIWPSMIRGDGAFREIPYPGYGVTFKAASNEYYKVVVDRNGRIVGIYLGWH